MLLRRFSAKGLCISPSVLRGFCECRLQRFQMTFFGEITDYHHAQHAMAVHDGFGNPALTVARDLIHNAIMHCGELLGREVRCFEPKSHDRKRMRHGDLEVRIPDPRGKTCSELELAID